MSVGPGMVLASLKTIPEAASPAWLPHSANWGNYLEVFRVIPFLRFAANSLVVAGWVTLLQVLTSALAAYQAATVHSYLASEKALAEVLLALTVEVTHLRRDLMAATASPEIMAELRSLLEKDGACLG